MDRLLNPRNDWAFKQILGQEKNKDILISFLNAMLKGVQEEIVDVTFLRVDTDSEIATLRQSIVDVLCKTTDGRHFIVEMQRASDSSFIKRALEYASRVYINQRTMENKEKGDRGGYRKLRPVIFLAIMEETLFPRKKEYLSHHKIQDIVTGECDIEGMSFTFLELSKFNKHFNELNNDIERWAYYFKKAERMSPKKLDEVLKEGTVFGKAYQVLQISGYSPEEYLEYKKYEWKEEEIETRILDARQQGIAEGVEKERVESERKLKLQKIESAKHALSLGLSVEIAAKISGLTEQEVKSL